MLEISEKHKVLCEISHELNKKVRCVVHDALQKLVVKKGLQLDDEEVLDFDIDVFIRRVKKHVVNPNVSQLRKLSKKDWDKILALPWSKPQRKGLLIMRRKDNGLVDFKYLFEKGDEDRLNPEEKYNYVFRKSGLKYRLRRDEEGGPTHDNIQGRSFNIWVKP
jgi:hypothetical protein